VATLTLVICGLVALTGALGDAIRRSLGPAAQALKPRQASERAACQCS